MLLAAALAGCGGFLRLGYDNAATLVYRWLDGYAGFDDAQATRVHAQIDRLHEWHREAELPHYAQLLERLARRAPAELTADEACSHLDEARARLDRLLDAAEPAIAQIAADLRPAQLRHLERRFSDVNRKYWTQWIEATPAAQMRRRVERAVERAERVYGTLEPPQLAVIRAQLERASFDPAATFAEARRRQRDTVETLRLISSNQALSPDARRAAVRGWLSRLQRSPEPAYAAHQHKLAREVCEGVAALHRSTTAAQRAHAEKRLGGYARDFRELGARVRSPATPATGSAQAFGGAVADPDSGIRLMRSSTPNSASMP